jgi:hypothetical protein
LVTFGCWICSPQGYLRERLDLFVDLLRVAGLEGDFLYRKALPLLRRLVDLPEGTLPHYLDQLVARHRLDRFRRVRLFVHSELEAREVFLEAFQVACLVT